MFCCDCPLRSSLFCWFKEPRALSILRIEICPIKIKYSDFELAYALDDKLLRGTIKGCCYCLFFRLHKLKCMLCSVNSHTVYGGRLSMVHIVMQTMFAKCEKCLTKPDLHEKDVARRKDEAFDKGYNFPFKTKQLLFTSGIIDLSSSFGTCYLLYFETIGKLWFSIENPERMHRHLSILLLVFRFGLWFETYTLDKRCESKILQVMRKQYKDLRVQSMEIQTQHKHWNPFSTGARRLADKRIQTNNGS